MSLPWPTHAGIWLAVALLCSPAAHADTPPPNCDIRKLELTPIQKAKLRFIRMEHKSAMDHWRSNQNQNAQRNQISQLLNRNEFDENHAKRYVFEKYQGRMQLEVDELRVQHAFLQVLNPQQRQEWLRNCLR